MISDSWFTENFTGISDDFFDFPLEDVEGVDDENAKFQNLEPPLDIYLFEGSKSNPISCNRAPQVKPHPSTTDTSSSRSICLSNNSNDGKDSRLLQTSSPVSVLENSSLCSAEKPTPISPKLVFAMKRTRSKHRRPASLNSLFLVPFITSTSSASEEYHPSTASESGSEINLIEKSVRKKQKRKKNLTMLSCSREIKKPYFQQTVVPRKCTHCGVSETPQWREGPMGPKTLCNACGVRYRSGRLVPEYRPAASPTFIPSVHSNSHKRIMEMRNKTRQ